MYLSRIKVSGLRASAEGELVCELPGRFSVLIGANGAGKTTLADALYLAHPSRFPAFPRHSSAALGPRDVVRSIDIEYSFGTDVSAEGRLGQQLFQSHYGSQGSVAKRWSVSLNRRMGTVTAKVDPLHGVGQELDPFKLIYLPAWRHPLDELARREARILIELLRAQQQRLNGSRSLVPLRVRASHLLEELAKDDIIDALEERIRGHLTTLSAGVNAQWPYIRGQVVDDAYLARVLELMLAVMEGRTTARPLEVSGLGYVNLLHIAVTLAAIPDTSEPPAAHSEPPSAEAPSSEAEQERIRERLVQAQAEAESEEDSFFPATPFHATVVIEEPEAHLHPQLQHALTRYLRRAVKTRPELQVILSSHATDVITSCDPEHLVVVRQTDHGRVCRAVATVVPAKDRAATLRMARLHLDASRSAALFAERLALVEGVTEAAILREFGRAWAGSDTVKEAFVDALSIVPVGTKVGEWAVHLLASRGAELCSKLAVLTDSDLPFEAEPRKPKWIPNHDPTVVDAFISHPTLEPAITEGNEDLIADALDDVGLDASWDITPEAIHEIFKSRRKGKGGADDAPAGPGAKKKAQFALALAGRLMDANDAQLPVRIPDHIQRLFDFLYPPTSTENSDVPADAVADREPFGIPDPAAWWVDDPDDVAFPTPGGSDSISMWTDGWEDIDASEDEPEPEDTVSAALWTEGMELWDAPVHPVPVVESPLPPIRPGAWPPANPRRPGSWPTNPTMQEWGRDGHS